MKIAILSDIHGNSWALEKVLEDLEKRKPDLIVNLGDILYGPLNPNETFKMLKSQNIVSISGNQDRYMIENYGKELNNNTLKFVENNLDISAYEWLKSLPSTQTLDCNVFMCHGTPRSDSTYLLEKLCEGYRTVNSKEIINEYLQDINQKIVFCGHSHTPRIVQAGNKLIINPGSIGLQAYDDDLPVFHKIENFSNHAKYALVEFYDESLICKQISISYDFEKAAICAEKNNRPDWAKWLRTGIVK